MTFNFQSIEHFYERVIFFQLCMNATKVSGMGNNNNGTIWQQIEKKNICHEWANNTFLPIPSRFAF